MTYYPVGLGTCGFDNSPSDFVVALSQANFGSGTIDNPLCGKFITISYGGRTVQAKIVDKCPGCQAGSIDVSQSVFEALASLGDGRVSVTWWFT